MKKLVATNSLLCMCGLQCNTTECISVVTYTITTNTFFHLLLFATSFYFTWLFFAVIYYIICYSHGDLELKSDNNVTQTPCVLELTDFASSFLFSLETQVLPISTMYIHIP